MNKTFMIVGGFVVVLALGIGGLLLARPMGNASVVNTTPQSNSSVQSMSEETTPSTDIEASPSAATGEVKEFTLEAGSFYYKPNEIRVKKGDVVKVTINSVSMMHDFNIDELGVKLPVTQSGNSNSVEFTATEEGTFEFYCGVGNHREMGQTGTLIVE